MTRPPLLRSIVAGIVFAAMTPASVSAQTAPGFGGLIGMRGSSLDNEMSQRGFSFAKNVGGASMYWNRSTRTCVSVYVDDGRVRSIQSASASDCGHSSGGSGDAAAAAVAGVALVGLVAALSSHHKSTDNAHSQQANHDSEYQRGYSDGLYGSPYAQQDSEPYHEGFLAGEAEASNRRAANTSYTRSAPANARAACEQRGDQFMNMPAGTSIATSYNRLGNGNYDVVVSAGHYKARCEATADGRVIDINSY